MSAATIIYPHQLFLNSPALSKKRPVYLVEEALLLTKNPIHRQRLILHKLSLDAYQEHLQQAGYEVIRLTIADFPTTKEVFQELKRVAIDCIHIVDTTDDYLEQAITKSDLKRVWYESPMFILEKQDAIKRYQNSKRKLATFYKKIRQDNRILIDEENNPIGGQWSFDGDNRKKLPRDIDLPEDLRAYGNADTKAAIAWAATVNAEQYGDAGCWLPYTHTGAQKFLQEFLGTRFHHFGPYEDAITTSHTRLWHSTLSPLLNIGLLTPSEVIEAALTYADKNNVPINSLEGFVRQIVGWREFIRASYESDGGAMRQHNFWQHANSLPETFWTGQTKILPVDHTISTALQYGYTHHIERLMVMGNFMLLCQIQPKAVYRWFMGMYIDAYDWVMVPNVYGMSQFSDGGSFATKPYISGAHYLKKMSDYESGDWEATWTGLYWHFIDQHAEFFSNNHRLAMMPRLLDRMAKETKDAHLNRATTFLSDFF